MRNLDNYVPVHQRVLDFRDKYSDKAKILTNTELLEFGEDIFCKVVAEIYIEDDVPVATGTAMVVLQDVENELEKTETKAVGRALAFLGIAADESIASREDVEEALSKEESAPAPAKVSRVRAAKVTKQAEEEQVQEQVEEPKKAPRTRTSRVPSRRVR